MKLIYVVFCGIALSNSAACCLWDKNDQTFTCNFQEEAPDDGWKILRCRPNQEVARSGNSSVYCRTLSAAAAPVVVEWAKPAPAGGSGVVSDKDLPPISKQQEFDCTVIEEAWVSTSGDTGGKRKLRLSCEVRQ